MRLTFKCGFYLNAAYIQVHNTIQLKSCLGTLIFECGLYSSTTLKLIRTFSVFEIKTIICVKTVKINRKNFSYRKRIKTIEKYVSSKF